VTEVTQQSRAPRIRRWQSTTAEPPPAGGQLPSVANSRLLRTTPDSAIRAPGIKWVDEEDPGPVRSIVGGRETRKMNTYQAVRDAMRCACVNYEWIGLLLIVSFAV
jgi:2-oxoisovalerate dehydrogenase E1 component beta subunit